MPRVDVCSDARDGDATSSDIQTRRPALKTRVSASACTDIRGNAMRWGSAIRNGQNLVVKESKQQGLSLLIFSDQRLIFRYKTS